jgi:hypothetical protein
VIGLLINKKQVVEWELAEETKLLGENLRKWHLFHQKSHIT